MKDEQRKFTPTLSKREKLSYSIGAMGGDLSYGLNNSFFSIYLTDILGIRAGFLSVMFLLARVWDGVNDPMMGTIVQNTRTKMGRFRPWILAGSFANALVLIMMFTNPGLRPGGIGVYIYASFSYILWGMSYTMYDIPFWSFIPAITTDAKQRNGIATLTRFFSGLGQALVSLLTVPMVTALGSGSEATGYRNWAMVCALFFVVVSSLSVSGTKERALPEKKESFTFGKAFKVIKSNDQLLAFMLMAICFNTGWYLTTGLGMYYFTHVIGNKSLYTLFAAIVGVAQMIGLLLFPILSAKFTKHRVVKGAMVIAAAGYLGMFLLRGYRGNTLGTVPLLNVEIDGGFAVFAVFATIVCIGVGAMFVSQTVMLADVVDYGQFKSGERTDSIIFSMKSFLLKVAYSLQALIMFIGLEIAKYDAKAVTQTAKNAICFMMMCIPAVLIVCAYFVYSRKYKLHGKLYDEVNAFTNQNNA